jgi:tetratricopeptide (TPR) repeat protein
MRLEFRFGAQLCFSAMLLAGCGSSNSQLAEKRVNAYEAAAKGDEAFQIRDYSTAAERLASAVDGGGLNPDAYAAAAVKLAVCYGATGKFTEANDLLDKLEKGAPNLDQVYAARSFVLRKQGKAAESRAVLAKARRYNRLIQEFKD